MLNYGSIVCHMKTQCKQWMLLKESAPCNCHVHTNINMMLY